MTVVRMPEVCTVATYAAAKGLPEDFLRGLGLRDVKQHQFPAIEIPYFTDATKMHSVIRYRRALTKSPAGDFRFTWRPGAKPTLYGLWREDVVSATDMILVEGESDCHTLWHHKIPALGIPGAGNWKETWASALTPCARIFVVIEPDGGGSTMKRWIAKSSLRRRIYLVRLPTKDVSDLYLADPGAFTRAWTAAIREAIPFDHEDQPEPEFLDSIPELMTRPLMSVNDRTYAATWLAMPGKDGDPPALTIVRDDGRVFSDCELPGYLPLSGLGFAVRLSEQPDGHRMWSGAGLRRFRTREVATPEDVFARLRACFSHFVDFDRSLADQQTMADLLACYVLGTYFLDAFPMAGSVWVNGEAGTGKTLTLKAIGSLSYLGQVILAGGSYAALRDMADYGATLCFDDAENVNDKDFDAEKKALILAGSYKGTTVPLKEPPSKKGGKWQTRNVSTFCTRAFCAISRPTGALASRVILIPLVKSDRVVPDPEDPRAWPLDRRQLVDDCWATALAHLARLRDVEIDLPSLTTLRGRALDPWKSILSIALWLDRDHGCTDLFNRLERVAQNYQRENDGDLDIADPTRLLIKALAELFEEEPGPVLIFTAKQAADAVQKIALRLELTEGADAFTSARKVGHVLRRLRIPKPPRGKNRAWTMTRTMLQQITTRHGVLDDSEADVLSSPTPDIVVPVVPVGPVVVREELDRELFDAEAG